jgi:hypothetical protein
LEVAGERLAWCHGDDLAAVLPDAVEELAEQLVALGGLLLDLPEAGEVVEQRLDPRDVGVDWRADPLDLLLQRPPADLRSPMT